MNSQFSKPVLITPTGETHTLERVQLNASETSSYDEKWLQNLLYSHPETLPINEIDNSYLNIAPICCELNTPAGPIDVLYATPEGKLVILEVKLWRNPEARRKVIGQILDYAKELVKWEYEDLQREVSRALRKSETQGKKLFNIIESKFPEISEAEFVDAVSRNLKRGEFLLLIVGDGIREGVASITEFLESHGTLHFTFGLVEMAIFKVNGEGVLVQPRVIAQTMIVKRTVISLEADGLVATDEGVIDPPPPDPNQKFYSEFWTDFINGLNFDDTTQPYPNVTKVGNISLSMPRKSHSWITIYFSQANKEVGLFLTFTRGALAEMIYEKLLDQKETIDDELAAPVRWESNNGKHTIGLSKTFPDLKDTQYREPIKSWLADFSNRFVNVFRHRIERIISESFNQ